MQGSLVVISITQNLIAQGLTISHLALRQYLVSRQPLQEPPVECASLKPAEGKPVGSVAKFDDLIYPVVPKTMFCANKFCINAVTAANDSKKTAIP